VHFSPVVEERGLALWSGTASDIGAGVEVTGGGWSVRAAQSMTFLPVDNHLYSTFQQVEVVRAIVSRHSLSIAGGGGVRQDWDGTSALIGRALAGADVGGGRLEGSLVLERVFSSPVRHDAADLITTLGWSRRVTDQVGLGFEGIGQDLEGFWNPAEVDGGAKLLIGPSLQLQSKRGVWRASATAGPVMTSLPSGGRRFGIFASATRGW
jgi:hypothetical protein